MPFQAPAQRRAAAAAAPTPTTSRGAFGGPPVLTAPPRNPVVTREAALLTRTGAQVDNVNTDPNSDSEAEEAASSDKGGSSSDSKPADKNAGDKDGKDGDSSNAKDTDAKNSDDKNAKQKPNPVDRNTPTTVPDDNTTADSGDPEDYATIIGNSKVKKAGGQAPPIKDKTDSDSSDTPWDDKVDTTDKDKSTEREIKAPIDEAEDDTPVKSNLIKKSVSVKNAAPPGKYGDDDFDGLDMFDPVPGNQGTGEKNQTTTSKGKFDGGDNDTTMGTDGPADAESTSGSYDFKTKTKKGKFDGGDEEPDDVKSGIATSKHTNRGGSSDFGDTGDGGGSGYEDAPSGEDEAAQEDTGGSDGEDTGT